MYIIRAYNTSIKMFLLSEAEEKKTYNKRKMKYNTK